MKHIVNISEYLKENNDEESYEAIPPEDFTEEYVEFKKNEIDLIKKWIEKYYPKGKGIKSKIETSHFLPEMDLTIFYGYGSDEIKNSNSYINGIVFNYSNRLKNANSISILLSIFKNNDEYFFVKEEMITDHVLAVVTPIYWRCDQLKGLEECIRHISRNAF
jgi:hypothetical protein